jgi:hypothetical protein
MSKSLAVMVSCVGLWAFPVHAQKQVTISDLTLTATAQNTVTSGSDMGVYIATPLAGTPANWKSPVDFSSGMAYVRLDVLDKPSDRKTELNICMVGMPAKACLPYSPIYTAKGTYNFSATLSSIYGFDQVDWTKGVNQLLFILKDDTGKEVPGDAQFFPTTMHVTITIVAPGETYVPPSEMKDAGMPNDASVKMPDSSVKVPDSSVGSKADAGTQPRDAGETRADAALGSDAGRKTAADAGGAPRLVDAGNDRNEAAGDAGAPLHRSVRDYLKSGGACSAMAPSAPRSGLGALASMGFALVVLRGRRRQRRPNAEREPSARL